MELTESDHQFLVNALHTAAAAYEDCAATAPSLEAQFLRQRNTALAMAERFEQAEKIKICD